MAATTRSTYRPTESQYKNGAREMYVTYDLARRAQSGGASVPKVKRVYIAGDVADWRVGTFAKRTGKKVRGVKIEYRQSRSAYKRSPRATSSSTEPVKVARGASRFTKVVEVPKTAENVRFHAGRLPRKYQSALQSVR